MTDSIFIGIDLGTSNSALAISKDDGQIIPITQVVQAGQIDEKNTLPSAVYFPYENEFAETSNQLPWESKPSANLVGSFARDRGADAPERQGDF